MSEQMEIPRYRCLKTVRALKIKFINPSNRNIVFEDERFAPIQVDESFLKKHEPHVGGYYVVYEDGYTSFSPSDVFEQGYSLL